jgi:predicted DNA-binding transcriptional regulator AlpA
MEITDLMTPAELGKKLKVDKSWIYARTRETGPDAIPRIRLGKYLRFSESAVVAWINKRQG